MYCLGGETYKPIIPLFLRSLAENREKRKRTRRNGKKPEKNQFSMILFRTSRVVVPFPTRNCYEQLNFRFLFKRYIAPYSLDSVSRPIFRQNGKGNRNSPASEGEEDEFPSGVLLSFFDIEPRKSKDFLLKRVWKQYFLRREILLSLSPSPPRLSLDRLYDHSRQRKRGNKKSAAGDGCKIKFCANK